MKLNAAVEMEAVTWPEFSTLHPYVPVTQAAGYQTIIRELETALCQITGFAAVSLQPNSGAQGEYAGLLGNSCLSSGQWRDDSGRGLDSLVRSRDKPCECGHGRHEGCRRGVR